ncbi:MAG: DUF4364 family protein [Lachnospiraceae bacterium]|nr:DUF4364 family protein [Lachnospiraceae bacterium]
MIESSYALYKLVILYMLDQVNFPLSNAQISEFFLDQEYTSYFHVQQVLNEMQDSDLIIPENTQSTTYYKMTENGAQTLKFFRKEISDEIRRETKNYLARNEYRLRSDSSSIADYYRVGPDDYAAHCVVRENDADLIDLTLHVPTESGAVEICENWKKKSQEAYAAIIELLM